MSKLSLLWMGVTGLCPMSRIKISFHRSAKRGPGLIRTRVKGSGADLAALILLAMKHDSKIMEAVLRSAEAWADPEVQRLLET